MNVKGKGGSKVGTITDGPAPLAGYQLAGCSCTADTHWWSPRGSSAGRFFSTRLLFKGKSLSNFYLPKLEYFSKVKIGFHHKLLKQDSDQEYPVQLNTHTWYVHCQWPVLGKTEIKLYSIPEIQYISF